MVNMILIDRDTPLPSTKTDTIVTIFMMIKKSVRLLKLHKVKVEKKTKNL